MSKSKPPRRPEPAHSCAPQRVSVHALAGLAACAFGAATLATSSAHADQFAEPPSGSGGTVTIASPARGDTYFVVGASELRPHNDTLVRFAVGPAGMLREQAAAAGMLVAADFGRGPAGFRAQAAWLGVGAPRGIAQYTGELTVEADLAELRPRIGAGGGVARTGSSLRDDGSVDAHRGATLGIGVVRAGVAYLLPIEADARIALDVSASIPAIRSDDAPEVSPYAIGALTVSLGF